MAGRSQQLRIIGGEHRGRLLRFVPVGGLRPTPDRVRETLFNWLAPVITGARCLDLFAGSGALGLEAASRGAGEVVMVEASDKAARQIQSHIDLLGLTQAKVYRQRAQTWLKQAEGAFDVVFLDPPYDAGLLLPSCEQLQVSGLLNPGCHIYLESAVRIEEGDLPTGWELKRAGQAGQVFYHLALRR